MKKIKRMLALLLAAIMVLTSFSTAVFAEGEGAESESQPVWDNPGSIKLDKDAAAVDGKENTWEVTLGIRGKNYPTTSDVVLVIDNSNSMYTKYTFGGSYSYDEDENSRMRVTKTAAKAFVENLLTVDSATRIALVIYGTDMRSYTDFYDATQKQTLLEQISAIAPESDSSNGGTNQQAGIHKAQELLDSSNAGLKNIVILTDGAPTYSYAITGTVTATEEMFDSDRSNYATSNVDWGTAVISCNYNSRVGSGRSFFLRKETRLTINGTKNRDAKTYITNGIATIWEANKSKTAGTTIYSVAFQADDDGKTTLQRCATNSQEGKGYFDISSSDGVEEKLTAAFTSIAGSIAIAAKNGVVSDTMGDKVQLSFESNAPTFTNDIEVYNAGDADVYISQGSATYDAESRSINWNVGNVSESDAPIMKYRVTLIPGVTYIPNETILTNKEATFTYTNYLGQNDVIKFFPKPEVTVGGGKILAHYYLVNAQGQPIAENGSIVSDPSLAKQVKDAEYFTDSEGNTGLSYNTPYTVSKVDIENCEYYGSYILNNGNLTIGDSVSVTLTPAASNQHVWFAYRQTFTVIHMTFNEEQTDVTETKIEKYDVEPNFTLTDKVTENYIYGGAFSNRECTTAAFTDGEALTGFTPVAGETYYIWEVPNAYLVPKGLSCWEHPMAEGDGYDIVDVIGFYLVTPVDREYYYEVGFDGIYKADAGDTAGSAVHFIADQDTEEFLNTDNEGKTVVITRRDHSVLYNQVRIGLKDGNTDVYDVSNFLSGGYSTGYLACYGMDKDTYWNRDYNRGATIEYTPYWITLDGVKVSQKTRTCQYEGAGSSSDGNKHKMIGMVGEDVVNVTNAYAGTTENIDALMLLPAYIADGSPIVYYEPEVSEVTITVHDNGNVYDVNVQPGNAVGTVTYAGAEGRRFAGWYFDEAFTTPADLTDVQENVEIYARYIDDAFFSVKYMERGFFTVNGISVVSAVDTDTYQDTGFVINGEVISCTQYSRYFGILSAQTLFGREVGRNAKLMSCTYSLRGMNNGDSIVVTPYWVTPDGTTVYGETLNLIYHRYGLKG